MEKETEKPKKLFSPFTIFVGIIFFGTIVGNFYFLYIEKNYDFIIEGVCNPSIEECFQRDCSEEGSCPANNLSNFKRYSLNAGDFKYCENEDCSLVCESGKIKCKQIVCEEDLETGESCTYPTTGETEAKTENTTEIE
jgi:hypothetical protein